MLRAIQVAFLGAAAMGACGEEAAIALDDECRGDGAEGSCSLSALQLRGQKLSEADPPYMEHTLVANEGTEVGYRSGMDAAGCESACDATPGCKSMTFGYSGSEWGKCFLKDKSITPGAPTSTDPWRTQRFKTYYKADSVLGYNTRSIVAQEGQSVGGPNKQSTPGACGLLCDKTSGCNSFSFSFGGNDQDTCYLKALKVSADDSESTDTWNREHYLTYYNAKTTLPEPVETWRQSSEYMHSTECTPGELISSVEGCRAAAAALGIRDTRPRIVPAEESTLPPGCFFGNKRVGMMKAGMWFNQLGLQFFKPELNKMIKADEGYVMLCKKHPYELAKLGAECGQGKDITSVGECDEATNALNLGKPQPVPSASSYTTTKGCYNSPSGAYKGVWFNGASMNFGADSSKEERLCRTEAPR